MNLFPRAKAISIAIVAFAVSTFCASAQVLSFDQAKQRADQGNAFAQAVVALHYQLGWNTQKNSELAAKYALASANAGNPLGQFRLGALLRAGEGVPKDEQQGLALQSASFNALYNAQDPYSITSAAIMIFQGKVVGQNISEDERRRDAAALYKKAAEMGYAPAQFNYAMCAEAGHGIAKDPQLRDSYIQEAESQSYPLAIQWLREQSPVATALATSPHSSQAYMISDQAALAEHDLDYEPLKTGDIETIVQEAPEQIQFVALGKNGHVLAVISDKVVHFYEAATGRLLRKISFREKTGKVGKRIYAGSRPSQFYVVLADDFAEPSETEQCFTLNYLTGELQNVSLPKGSLVVGSNPKTNALAIYQSNGQNAMLSEFDVDSGAVRKETVLPPAWREIVRAVYGVNGDCVIISLTAGEAVSLDTLTVISPGGDVRVIEPGAATARALARLLNFNPAAVVPFRQSGDTFFCDDYGIKSTQGLFGFVESIFACTSSDIIVSNGKDLAYLLAPSYPLEFRLSDLGLAVDGVGCSSDGRLITAWSIGFKTPSAFRQDGKLNTEHLSGRDNQALGQAFVYDLLGTTYSPIFTGANQVWNAAISEDGDSVALATSQVKKNNTPSSEFYGGGRQWPEVPSIEASAVLLNPWTGELLSRSGLSAIFPFVYAEQWLISPQVALAQTSLQFAKTRYTTDFSRWTVNVSGKEVQLPGDANDLRPRYQGWDIQEDTGIRSVTDNKTGECVSWRGTILQLKTADGNDKQIKLAKPIAGAYPLGDGKVAVATEDIVQIISNHGTSTLANWPILGEGLKVENNGSASQTFAVASNAQVAYVLAGDHGIHRISLADSSITQDATFYPQRSGPPVVVLKDGTYLVRGGAIRGIHFSDGHRTYPFEQFDLRLNRPDIVLERLGAPAEAVAIAKQLREKRLKRMGVTEEMLKPDFHVPELEVVGDVPTTTDSGEINLSIKASDTKYPLERLKVFVNNVPVNGRDGESLREESKTDAGLLGRITSAFASAPSGPKTLERTIPIKLAAGRNKIQVSVLNNAGAESLYANAEVNCTAKRPKPTLYAVAMGVSEYSNADWNLKYAAKDARDVLARLKAKAGDQHGEVKELLLTDKDVTKENLAKVRELLKSATIDDTVLMFAAGHGLLDSKYDYYFGTTDIDFNNPADKGIAFEEFDDLLADLPSLKKSLLIDTCHAGELDEEEKTLLASASGVSAALPTANGVAVRSIGTRGMNVKAVEGARGVSEWYDRLQGLFVDLRRGSGSTILSSSAGAEYALESSEQQNGLFTYAVLEALDGKKDADANKDGSVQMSELGEHVKKRVSELTNNKQTPNTRRVNLEGDFTVAKAR